jgi:hypothetical protein
MRELIEIRENLCKELKNYGNGPVTRANLETIHMLSDTIKNIDKIEGMQANGYSMKGGDWTAYGNYSRDGMPYGNSMEHSYGDDYSNANRSGMHYVRGHYSRADGKMQMLEDIDRMMSASGLSTDERNALQRARHTLEGR